MHNGPGHRLSLYETLLDRYTPRMLSESSVVYAYSPNKGAAIVLCVFFTALIALHTYQCWYVPIASW